MSYNIELNPCYSCLKNNPPGCDGTYNYATINRCLVDTSSAFAGKLGVKGTLQSTINDRNKECLNQVLYTLGPWGNGWYNECNHRLSASVSFNQIRHYVPDLVNKGYSKEEARNLCKVMCRKNGNNNVYECITACDIDADAIVCITPAEPINPLDQCFGSPPACPVKQPISPFPPVQPHYPQCSYPPYGPPHRNPDRTYQCSPISYQCSPTSDNVHL
jgi:hypothetical protein